MGRRFYSPDDKPTNEEKARLLRLINTPLQPEELTEEDKNLLWDFRCVWSGRVTSRHVLYGLRHALPKILYAMDLSDPMEEKNAIDMLEQWPELCLEDALQLLSNSIKQKDVRAFAVKKLDAWETVACVRGRLLDDESLKLYLLQLVQALRYESDLMGREMKEVVEKRVVRIVKEKSEESVAEAVENVEEKSVEAVEEPVESVEAVEKPVETVETVETVEKTEKQTPEETPEKTETEDAPTTTPEPAPEVTPTEETESKPIEENESKPEEEVIEEEIEEKKMVEVMVPHSPLLQFLIRRCAVERTLASLLLHYIRVEGNKNAKNASERNQGDFCRSC